MNARESEPDTTHTSGVSFLRFVVNRAYTPACGGEAFRGAAGGRVVNSAELAALIEQAARNLNALEAIVRAREGHSHDVVAMRQRLEKLRKAFTDQTDALTSYALRHAIERRQGQDRRQSTPPVRDATTSDA